MSLAQVYMCGRLCQKLVDGLPQIQTIPRVNQPRMAIGILEDSHVFGKQIVLQMIRSAGYEITDWGCQLKVEDIVNRVVEQSIDVLFISVLMLRSALLVKQVKQELIDKGSKTVLVVGGAPFRFDPELASEVGAEYFGNTASDALPILDSILANRMGT